MGREKEVNMVLEYGASKEETEEKQKSRCRQEALARSDTRGETNVIPSAVAHP